MSELVLEEENELPKNWIRTLLGNVIIPIKGRKPKILRTESTESSVPYINIKSFEKQEFSSFADEKNCPKCSNDDILIVWDGSRSGLVGTGVSGVIGSTLTKLFCFDINKKYLYYFLQMYYDKLNKNPKGIGIPHVNPEVLWSLNFSIPPVNEQKRIVKKIEEYFSIMEKINVQLLEIQNHIIEIKQSSLKTAFEGTMSNNWRHENEYEQDQIKEIILKIKDNQTKYQIRKKVFKDFPFHQIPNEWLWFMIHEISLKMGDAPFGSDLKSKDYVNSGIPVIHGTNITNGEFNWKYHLYVTKTKFESIPRSHCKKGDLVFQKIGATIGKCAFLPKIENHEKFLLSTNMMYVSTDPDHINIKYVYYYFQQKLILNYIRNSALGTAQPIFNYTTLKNFQIPIPIIDEQNFIVKKLDCIMLVIDENEVKLEKMFSMLSTLKQSILKRAFEGKLVPQDPNDEPAEVLLQKIKVEKEQLKQKQKVSRSKKNVK